MKKFWQLIFILAVAGSGCRTHWTLTGATLHYSGTVRDPSGEPAVGVSVSFYSRYSEDYKNTEVKTDAHGRYEINPIPRNNWPEVMGGIVDRNPTNSIMARDLERNLAAIKEFAETPATNLDLILQPGVTLSGSVKDTEGVPLGTATVEISFETGHSYGKLEERPTKVDAKGLFSIPALPQGVDYLIYEGITAKGYGSTTGGGVSAENTYTNNYELPTFVLKRADRKLAGQVLDGDGNPVAGANLSFRGDGQPQNSTAKTDRKGNFVFDAVCEGKVTLQAFWSGSPGSNDILAGWVETQAGDTNIVLKLRDPRPPNWPGEVTTRGKVFDPSGRPVSRASLVVGGGVNPFQMITSDNNGKYKIHWYPIHNEQSSVNPHPKSTLVGRDKDRNLAATQEIDATTTNLDLHLQLGCTLSGSVQNPDGTPVVNTKVQLYMKFFRAEPLLEQVETDANGLFSFKTLPHGGKYVLRVNAPGYGSVFKAAQFALPSDSLQLPPIKLKAANLQLAGTVVGPDEKPIAGVDVHIGGRGQPITNILTNAGGHFFFNHVAEGTIRVAAVTSQGGQSLNGFLQAQGAIQMQF